MLSSPEESERDVAHLQSQNSQLTTSASLAFHVLLLIPVAALMRTPLLSILRLRDNGLGREGITSIVSTFGSLPQLKALHIEVRLLRVVCAFAYLYT